MEVCDVDEEVLEKLIKEFTDEFGEEVLKEVYRFHRKLANKMYVKNFPAAEIYHRLLIKDIRNGKYANMSVRAIAAIEKVSEGTIYNIIGKACRVKKPIYQYSVRGKLIKKWNSGTEIEKELGYNASPIRASCREGNDRATYGFVWRYQELTGEELLAIRN
ncbi:MAG: hypothetical protein M0P61_00335 [Ignavibacteriaceae bacterium]|jgi:hypothetical protein|nr:hypothetical protein [Ignavibacteriaceae bacterium]